MISIVGNIKINDLQRLKYLKATLWSFEILKEYQLLLNIDCACITLDEITNIYKSGEMFDGTFDICEWIFADYM